MCTVTYIPQGRNQFILASNRDENHQRSTNSIGSGTFGKERVLFPVDPVSGGSWIVVSNSGKVACVLNGAFEKHHHKPPYAKSRGLVILDYFKAPDIQQFVNNYDFTGIEPFTLVVHEPNKLWEFRWDEKKAHLITIDANQPHMWSSSTLYDKNAIIKRNEWFRNWLIRCPEPGLPDLIHFHRFGGEQDLYNGLVMNRDYKVQTLSITAIERMISFTNLRHHDLINNKISQNRIDISEDEVMESI